MSNIENQVPSLGSYFQKPNFRQKKKKTKKNPSRITGKLNEENSAKVSSKKKDYSSNKNREAHQNTQRTAKPEMRNNGN